MKRGDFSYTNGHAQSHASLGRFRKQNEEGRAESISRQILYAKPNVKFSSVGEQQTKGIKKGQIHQKSDEELRQKIKQLEYELKKRISQNSYLVNFFKTKNSSQSSHIDIYLEMRQLEENLLEKDEKISDLSAKLEESVKQIEQLLRVKEEQEITHTNQIQTFSFQVDSYKNKCRIDMAEKDNQIKEERKMKDEKDLLLKEIKKQYEQMKNNSKEREHDLQQLQQQKYAIEEQMKKQSQEHEYKMNELHDQFEKSGVREQQKDQIIEELSCQIEQLKETVREKEKYESKNVQEWKEKERKSLNKYQEMENKIKKDEQAMKEDRERLFKINDKIKQLQLSLNSKDAQIKQLNNQKLSFQTDLGKLEKQLMEAHSTIKILQYSKEEKENALEKMTSKMKQECEETTHTIDQLQMKLYTAEKRASAAIERAKQLEKGVKESKTIMETVSNKDIQIYKAMGRLTELSHHLQSLQQTEKGKKRKGKQGMDESQNLTQCVDKVAQHLESFLKNIFSRLMEENKNLKEKQSQITRDFKSILYGYNSYVKDQQLKAITEEFMETLEEVGISHKKQTNSYLQLIMERLISMTAIQSYTSEKGVKRMTTLHCEPQFYSKNSDSLESTHRHPLDEEEEHDVQSYGNRIKRQNSTKRLQKNGFQRNSRSKMNSLKIHSEFDEVMIKRKLEYDKQNLMGRINKKEQKQHLEAIKQYGSNMKMSEEYQSMFRDRKLNETHRGKTKTEHSEAFLELQKKYYR